MRLIFAGTPVFAARALDALARAGHDIALVLTQPDRPAGRGQQALPSPVKQRALDLGLTVAQPPTLRVPEAQAVVAEVGADVMVVAAYGLILPQAVLDMPRHGCLNIHASLLPRWRGAAPIQRAIEAGDAATGITIMRMEAGLDTGPMLLEKSTPIFPDDTGGSLHDRLAAMGADLVVKALAALEAGTLREVPQPAEGVTYAKKLDKAESALDFALPADVLERRIRAFDPVPGSTAAWSPRAGEAGATLKVWSAKVEADDADAAPGTVLDVDPARGVRVACGRGSLWLVELQKPGGKRLPARAFLQGTALRPGDRLSVPPVRGA